MSRFAPLPEPPYYAVIFASQLSSANTEGYAEMAEAMVAAAQKQPGFLGVESTRDVHNFGITVSYWKDEGAIVAWKADVQHLVAQKLGKERWYERYTLRVAKVERAYDGP